jgi:peptidoglycan/xylan/chitin deacetylase (PgdA/CDA1 family)
LLKRALSVVKGSMAFAEFVSLLERVDGNRANLLAVLTYHRVDEAGARPHLSPELHSATPNAFDEQMRYLASHYRVVSTQEVLDAFLQGTPLAPHSVMVTFDDAYCGFAEHAWPILSHYRLPVTLFVPTAYPDQPQRVFWWDMLFQALNSTTRPYLDTPIGRLSLKTAEQRRQTYKRLRGYVKSLEHGTAMAWIDGTCASLGIQPVQGNVLGWDALRQLAREGVTLAAHTRTHPLMNRVSSERALAEAVGSLRDLEREVGQVPPVFAYPSGGFNDEVVMGLKREGFALAFTTVRGLNDVRGADRLRLRRINVGRLASLAVVRAQLLPSTVHLNRWRPLNA